MIKYFVLLSILLLFSVFQNCSSDFQHIGSSESNVEQPFFSDNAGDVEDSDAGHIESAEPFIESNSEAPRSNQSRQGNTSSVSNREEGGPNLVVLLVDDLGVENFPCSSEAYDDLRVPNLKKICKNSIYFSRAYAKPNCSPSRASLLTGLHGFRTGVGAAIGASLSNSPSLNLSNFETLNQFLSNSIPGLKTGAFGKWHLRNKSRDGVEHHLGAGFDYTFIREVAPDGTVIQPYQKERWVNGVFKEYPLGKQLTYGPALDVKKAVGWMKSKNLLDERFFAYVALDSVHAPTHVPPKHLHSFKNLDQDTDCKQNTKYCYLAMIEAMDVIIGRLVDGLPPNTFLILLSDNGTPNYYIRPPYHPDRSKGTVFKAGIHVPLLVQGPGIRGGRSVQRKVSIVDVFSTAAELMNVRSPENEETDSRSFADALFEGSSKQRNFIYSEIFGFKKYVQNNGWTVIHHQYKYIALKNNVEFCFDYRNDPLEIRPLDLFYCEQLKNWGNEKRSSQLR